MLLALVSVLPPILEQIVYFVISHWIVGKTYNWKEKWHQLGVPVLWGILLWYVWQLPTVHPSIEMLTSTFLPLVAILCYAIWQHRESGLIFFQALTLFFVVIISQLIFSVHALWADIFFIIHGPRSFAQIGLLIGNALNTLAFAWLIRRYLCRFFYMLRSAINRIGRREFWLIGLSGILIIATLSMLTLLVTSEDLKYREATILLIGAVIVVIFVLQSVLVYRYQQRAKEASLLSAQGSMLESYQDIMNDLKGFWHSYANIMQVIDMMVSSDQVTVRDVREALEEFSNWNRTHAIGDKLILAEVPHLVLACVLSTKLSEAKSLGVHFNIQIAGQGPINCNMRDLTEILGILLDNATQVAYHSDQTVSIRGEIQPHCFLLTVTNHFSMMTASDGTAKVHKQGTSHGIGLKRVKDIAKAHGGMKFKASQIDQTYIAQLEIG